MPLEPRSIEPQESSGDFDAVTRRSRVSSASVLLVFVPAIQSLETVFRILSRPVMTGEECDPFPVCMAATGVLASSWLLHRFRH